MNNKKIIASLIAIVMTGSLLISVPSAFAQTPGAVSRPNFFQGFLLFLEQRFGLNQTQVQNAVTDYSKQRKATITPRPTLSAQQITNREKEKLDILVKDGKLLSDQETAILNELATLRSKYNFDPGSNLTPQERKTLMKNMRDEIIAWAKSQGIDSSYVMPFGMMGGFRGIGTKGMGWDGQQHWNRGVNPTTSP